ncbi:MAG: DUF6298 domain-containing protein [Nibricoccus sp.]
MKVTRKKLPLRLLFAALALAIVSLHAEQLPPLISHDKDSGKLKYSADDEGSLVPDFSHAGYAGGGVALPIVPVKFILAPEVGDNTARIQAALDRLAGLPIDETGFRGAVLLKKGRYEIEGQLRIKASGVVLRGEGQGADGTVLVATGTDRRALILVRGKNDLVIRPSVAVDDKKVSVGSVEIHVKNQQNLKSGDTVLISRPATAEWIKALGMHISPGRQQFAWKPQAMTIVWERTIVSVKAGAVTLEAPLTTALDEKYGGGTVSLFSWPGRLTKIGVENVRCESTFDPANPLDEQHAWEAVAFDHVRDAWAANITALHFAGSVINLGSGASRVTVQDCESLAPVSELGGYRRHTFTTAGQQTLFLRCRSQEGRADFCTGNLAAGPNVFLECIAIDTHGASGSVGSWASGSLFDNVSIDGGTLALDNRETWNQGVGWAAANSMLWQCSASVVVCRKPPTAQNWADGVWGQFVGDGRWSMVNEFVKPDSLYRAQLEERRGAKGIAALAPRTYPTFNDDALQAATRKTIEDELLAAVQKPKNDKPLALRNGWLTANGALLTGRQADVAWWRGYLVSGREDTKPSITRFAPGLIGPEYTDDLDEMTDNMLTARSPDDKLNAGQVAVRQHYGLWYERRRMDHERIRRPDADVWPPFFEQPFARSGQGRAFDGLSKYDLTKYNPWYFGRLREFAALGRRKGLVLINAMYFQHNILEAGAHWVDFPWRPTNCLQPTGFTEPPPFDGDTVKMAAEFYDLSNPLRRDLHRRYIRHCLEALSDEPNVIHHLSAENSGPLHFMQFWLDVVAEWEQETGKHPLIALSACKDVQDAVLADARRASVIDVIDLKYWFRTEKGAEFAPSGGTDLAPRQHERLWKKGRPNPATIADMVAEYRIRFPEKAIISGLDEADGWAFVAAGGSFAKLPRTTDPRLLTALAKMKPVETRQKNWRQLSGDESQSFIYTFGEGSVKLDLRSVKGSVAIREIDLKTGAVASERTTAGQIEITGNKHPAAFWITPIP